MSKFFTKTMDFIILVIKDLFDVIQTRKKSGSDEKKIRIMITRTHYFRIEGEMCLPSKQVTIIFCHYLYSLCKKIPKLLVCEL